jgi:hypothetical protein
LKGLPQKPLATVGMPHHNPALLDAAKQKLSIIMSQEESFPQESASTLPERQMITDIDDSGSSFATPHMLPQPPYQPTNVPMQSFPPPPERDYGRNSRSLSDLLQQQQQGYAPPPSASYSFQPPKLPQPSSSSVSRPPNQPNNNATPLNPFAKYIQPTAQNNNSSTGGQMNAQPRSNPPSNLSYKVPTTAPPTSNIPPSSSAPSTLPSTMLLTPSQYAEIVQQNEANIVETVLRELVPVDSPITFQDIAALDHAKKLLYESIVLPTLMPQFFTGIRQAWKVSSFSANLRVYIDGVI